MKFFKTAQDLPDDIREICEDHLSDLKVALQAARKFGGCKFRSETPTFHAQATPDEAYADDRNTRVPGTRYSIVLVWDLKHPAHVHAGADWHSHYRGYASYSILSSFYVHLRDSDRQIWMSGTDLNVGMWPGAKMERITHTNGTKVGASTEEIATLVLKVREVVARLDVLAQIKSLEPVTS